MKKFFLLIPLLFLFIACQNTSRNEEQASTTDLKTIMPGIWESVSLKITISSPDSIPDSTFILDVKEENWTDKLGIMPIRTYYEPNNTYRSEYRNINDSIYSITRGIWNVFGDTLMLISPDATYEYEVNFENGLGTFHSLLDWDGDGQNDDEYIGVQRYISKSTSR